jgi:ribosomal protein S18 acetylase RimI-like enzyme
MASFEIRPANSNDFPRLMAMDHSCSSDYVWQLELRSDPKRVTADFHEVRLPRSVTVAYPRNPSTLADEWAKRDVLLVVVQGENPVGYLGAVEERSSGIARVMDLVVATETRRRGAASALLLAIQAWAGERGVRRIVLETQSKNYPCIRLAQKFGYEFCGYNDQYYPTQDVALFFGRALK